MYLLWLGAQVSFCLPSATVHRAMLGTPSTLYNTASRPVEATEGARPHRQGRSCTREVVAKPREESEREVASSSKLQVASIRSTFCRCPAVME